jgi:hypothetical protein
MIATTRMAPLTSHIWPANGEGRLAHPDDIPDLPTDAEEAELGTGKGVARDSGTGVVSAGAFPVVSGSTFLTVPQAPTQYGDPAERRSLPY